MQGTTRIDSLGFKFSDKPHETITAITFYMNEKILHKNFQNLKKLKSLWLKRNRIEKISSDTFQDLASLEKLDLGKILSCEFVSVNQSFVIFYFRV